MAKNRRHAQREKSSSTIPALAKRRAMWGRSTAHNHLEEPLTGNSKNPATETPWMSEGSVELCEDRVTPMSEQPLSEFGAGESPSTRETSFCSGRLSASPSCPESPSPENVEYPSVESPSTSALLPVPQSNGIQENSTKKRQKNRRDICQKNRKQARLNGREVKETSGLLQTGQRESDSMTRSDVPKTNNYKCCLVPECSSTTIKNPGKKFVTLPREENKRVLWLKAIGRNPAELSQKSTLSICEDHFNLEEDVDNYVKYKYYFKGKRIPLKPDVVPHVFACQKDRTTASNLRVYARIPGSQIIDVPPADDEYCQTGFLSMFNAQCVEVQIKEESETYDDSSLIAGNELQPHDDLNVGTDFT